jgi:hypothetical protein
MVFQCPIPMPNSAIYEAILEKSDEVDEPLEVKQVDLIVLTQACDLENSKVTSLPRPGVASRT